MSRGFWAVVQTCDRKDLRDSNVVGSVGFLRFGAGRLGQLGPSRVRSQQTRQGGCQEIHSQLPRTREKRGSHESPHAELQFELRALFRRPCPRRVPRESRDLPLGSNSGIIASSFPGRLGTGRTSELRPKWMIRTNSPIATKRFGPHVKRQSLRRSARCVTFNRQRGNPSNERCRTGSSFSGS